MKKRLSLAALAAVSALALSPASAQEKVLRIGMTASDIPTTTGMPNNGFEGMRFLGFPIFEGLIQFDLTRTPRLVDPRLEWPVHAQEREPAHTRDGLQPIALFACRRFRRCAGICRPRTRDVRR